MLDAVDEFSYPRHGETCRYCALDSQEAAVVSNKDGYAVPSFGAMVEGWLVIFPREHVLSLADLDEDRWNAFGALVESGRRLVEEQYGATISFEHGSSGAGRPAACGVDHAHMHIVPLDIDLRTAIAAVEPEFVDWNPVSGRVCEPTGNDYLYIRDRSGEWVASREWISSQVIRRAIAAHLDIAIWDWKADRRIDIVTATRDRFRSVA